LGKDAWANILSNGRATGYSWCTCSLTSHYCDADIVIKIIDKLGLSFSSTKELNDIIDKMLPGRPPFECHNFDLGGETLEFYFRDVLSCIRSIFGDPGFAQDLIVAPERHYADHERTEHVYGEMHTGDWWWAVQVHKLILSLNNSNDFDIGADNP
jgi:hypothetical protein